MSAHAYSSSTQFNGATRWSAFDSGVAPAFRFLNAMHTFGLSFLALFGQLVGGTALHASGPYATEALDFSAQAFMAAQHRDLRAFENFDTPISLDNFKQRLALCASDPNKSVLDCFADYDGPTTRHVIWTLAASGGTLISKGDFTGVLARDVRVPLNLKDALTDPTWANEWRKALANEMSNMTDNGVWEIVPIPPDGVDNFVDTKFVFKCKAVSDGSIDKFKVRLVAHGFTQIHNVDYWGTYASVVRGPTFRMQMADAVQRGLTREQIDFDAAFLQADIHGHVYLKISGGCGVDVQITAPCTT